MKTILVTLCLLIATNFYSNAQTVTIPDANFATWLTKNIPAAMNGNQMDTSSTLVKTLTTMDVENKAIADLNGVQYFTSLLILDCGNGDYAATPNVLKSLPTLPNSLKELICGNNQITSLPKLPSTLEVLKCYKNPLGSLPTLPNSLLILYCHHNQLVSLPALPNGLQYINCQINSLTTLPTLPDSLEHLECTYNSIQIIPSLLSTKLKDLICYNNNLTALPTLPSSLEYLVCAQNPIINLPALPTGLLNLACGYNKLTNLPALPPALQGLSCNNNHLTSLPELPKSLKWLECNENSITCFPTFPNSLNDTTYFHIFGNPFTCLPNYVSAMDSTTLAFPLCVSNDKINNPNGCGISSGITGFTYKDNNSNCIFDTGELNLKNIHTLLYNNTNTLIEQTYTALNGIYNFVQSEGSYTVKIDTANVPFTIQCIHPGIDSTIALSNVNTLVTDVNFNMNCKPGFDIGVQSVVTSGWVFPGQQHSLNINAGDFSRWYNLNCAAGISGQMKLIVNGPVKYNGIVAGALIPTIDGNTFTYTIADFGTIKNNTAFGLLFTTDTSAQGGDTICVHINVSPETVDNVPSNNTYDYCYSIVNSHDPNMKEVYPINVEPGYKDWLNYTIHFQNTGTAPAMNIRLADTLDSNLDLETFQVVNYSHANRVSIHGKILSIYYPNIQLPDSSSNQIGSQGFVQYRIKPKAGLPLGTQIKNTAYIYFDYNPAIVTNTTINKYELKNVTSIHENESNTSMVVYPNPGDGKYFLKIADEKNVLDRSIEVYNILGEVIFTIKMQTTITPIDLGQQPNGVYILKVISRNGILTKRLIKN